MTAFDFKVEIGPPGVEGSYPVVAHALGGDADGTLRWSWTPADFERQLAVIQHHVLASSALVPGVATEDELPVRELGLRLFETLIAGDVRDLYVISKQRIRMKGGVLRLVLQVRPPELARLPWEFLFDPGQQDYLGLIAPLVRYPQVPAPHQSLMGRWAIADPGHGRAPSRPSGAGYRGGAAAPVCRPGRPAA